MRKVRTHTFKLGKYKIEQISGHIDGTCDVPGESGLTMTVPDDGSLRALWTILHESLHANGLPDKHLDGEHDVSEEVARLLKRMGWDKREAE